MSGPTATFIFYPNMLPSQQPHPPKATVEPPPLGAHRNRPHRASQGGESRRKSGSPPPARQFAEEKGLDKGCTLVGREIHEAPVAFDHTRWFQITHPPIDLDSWLEEEWDRIRIVDEGGWLHPRESERWNEALEEEGHPSIAPTRTK